MYASKRRSSCSFISGPTARLIIDQRLLVEVALNTSDRFIRSIRRDGCIAGVPQKRHDHIELLFLAALVFRVSELQIKRAVSSLRHGHTDVRRQLGILDSQHQNKGAARRVVKQVH